MAFVYTSKNKVSFKEKLALNLKAMKSLFKLLNASYWQSVFGPIMAFIFPLIFIGLYGYIMKAQFSGDISLLKSSLVGLIAMMSMSFAINAIPTWINDFKQSVLLKRIGSTPIKPISFLLTVGVFSTIILVVQVLWLLAWIAIWFNKDVNKILGSEGIFYFGPNEGEFYTGISWSGFIFAIFYTIITSIFIGLLVVCLSKSALASNVIGMIIFFMSQFLSGQVFPIQNIVQTQWLNVISYFTPFRYTTGLLTMSWNGANIFNIKNEFNMYISLSGKTITIYHIYDLWLNYFLPVVFVCLSIFFSIKNFKWNSR